MHTRFMIGGLIACALLVAVAILQLATPHEHVRPRVPTRLNTTPLGGTDGGQPLSAKQELEAAAALEATRPLPEPPPAPEVESSTATGLIWLRVIDAVTNRPVVDTQCRCVVLPPTISPWDEDQPPKRGLIHRATDDNGLISFTFGIFEKRQDVQHCEAAHITGEGTAWAPMPAPPGWYAEIDPYEINRFIASAGNGPQLRPLDIPVRRLASITVTPRDAYGVPIADAEVRVVPITDDFDGRFEPWLPDDMHSLPMHSWLDSLHDIRTAAFGGITRAWLNGALLESDEGLTEELLDLDFTTGGRGVQRYSDLPLVRFAAFTWHPDHGFAAGEVQLLSGPNALDLTMQGDSLARLDVHIEWHGGTENIEFGKLELHLSQVSPYGRLLEGAYGYWAAPESAIVGATRWTITVTGLQPGWWQPHVVLWDDVATIVELKPGEHKAVTLYLGDDAAAQWTPIVRANGQPLSYFNVMLHGGDFTEPAIYTDLGHGGDPADLDAGDYTAWIPTLPPFHFSLKPGESRTDEFDLHVANISFSIDPELWDFLVRCELDPDDTEPNRIELQLYADDEWTDEPDHLHALDELMRAADEEYDVLKPGETKTWLVPLGRYRWALTAARVSLTGMNGPLEVSARGESHIHFSFNNLPGRAAVLFECDGFADDMTEISARQDASAAFLTSSLDDVEDLNGVELATLYSPTGDRVLVIGWPGECSVTCEYTPMDVLADDSDFEYERRVFTATLPGRQRLTPATLNSAGITRLVLETSSNFITGDSESYANLYGSGISIQASGGDTIEVASGRWRLEVWREYWNSERQDFVRETATVDLTVAGVAQTVDLDTLSYAPPGRARITCRGRGSPDRSFDAWWFVQDYSGDSNPSQPRLIRLGDGIVPDRVVWLSDPGEFMPEGRLEFTFNESLLPGRYKFIPWFGAQAKWCRVFEVLPGRQTDVIVQGG